MNSMRKYIFIFFLFIISAFFVYKFFEMKPQSKGGQSYFIVNTKAGIGNQMFRYAFGLNYAKRFNKKICIPKDNGLSSVFNISAPICESSNLDNYLKLLGENRFSKKTAVLDSFKEDGLQNSPDYTHFDGFQQDPRYFREINDLIPQEFSFKNPLTGKAGQIALEMEKTNSVCLHFRRGDYLKQGYPVLGNKYYLDAINYIKEKTKLPVHVYAFSNDMKWVKENFKPKDPITYVEGFDAATDLHLMTQCKHNVIANSTFSWWGAFLNKNADKIVVAPDVWDRLDPDWGKHLILPSWDVLHADYTKGQNVAIIYLATGRYIQFFRIFYPAMEKYFLPDIPKTYFVFTDDTTMPLPKNAIRIYQEQLPWPYITLKRFHFINSQARELANYEYIFFTNANLFPIKPIGKEILPTNEQQFVFAEHFFQSPQSIYRMTYERDPKSKAYIPYGEGKYYVMGGFFGGKSMSFLNLSRHLQAQIDEDLKNGIIAQWHDESHLNRFVSDLLKAGNDPIVLGPTVLVPQPEYEKILQEQKDLDQIKDTRIIILDKNRSGGNATLRQDPNFFRRIYYKIKLFINNGILK